MLNKCDECSTENKELVYVSAMLVDEVKLNGDAVYHLGTAPLTLCEVCLDDELDSIQYKINSLEHWRTVEVNKNFIDQESLSRIEGQLRVLRYNYKYLVGIKNTTQGCTPTIKEVVL